MHPIVRMSQTFGWERSDFEPVRELAIDAPRGRCHPDPGGKGGIRLRFHIATPFRLIAELTLARNGNHSERGEISLAIVQSRLR